MANLFKLTFVPGQARAQREALRGIQLPEEPGVYALVDRHGTRYYHRNGQVTPVTEEEAEEIARGELSPGEALADRALNVGSASELPPEVPASPTPEPTIAIPEWSARAQLIRDNCDWQVMLAPVYDYLHQPNEFRRVEIAKATRRVDTKRVIAVVGCYYRVGQNRDVLSLCDEAAQEDRIRYTEAYATEDSARVAIRFELTTGRLASIYWRAGGVVATSHDSSTLVEGYATVAVAGVHVFSPGAFRYRHTKTLADRVKQGRSALNAIVKAGEGLVMNVEAAARLPLDLAGQVVFKMLREVIPAKLGETEAEKLERVAKQTERDGKLADRLVREAGYRLTLNPSIGGAAFAIAAAAAGGRVSDYGLRWGVGRERVTRALTALAKVEAILRAVHGENLVKMLGAADPDTRQAWINQAFQRLGAEE